MKFVNNNQGRIQDFPWGWDGGTDLIEGVLISYMHYGKNICENERIGSYCGGGCPLDPPMFMI